MVKIVQHQTPYSQNKFLREAIQNPEPLIM